MSRGTKPNEIQAIAKGFTLVMACHGLAVLMILILGSIVESSISLGIWVLGAMGFLFWQLLYVIPLTIWLKRRGKVGMMKGVITGAVLTALVNGACYLSML